MSKKFRVSVLGCRTNQYEAQAFRDQLIGLGYEPAGEGEAADLCVVNTCTVTESADRHSRREIRQLARQNPGAEIAVTGCYAERNPEAVEAIEGVTRVIPNKEKEVLLHQVLPDEEIPEFKINHFEAHTRAFVKVQDGCNSFCTYCIIPYVRGRSKSRSIPDIVDEVEKLIACGFKEIVLTGINIGDFDGGGESTLAELVKVVDQIPGVERLRLSSIDPDEVDDALMGAIIHGKHTCPSMHIVLQSGSNVILKRMNRKYTRQMFFEAIDRLKGASPDFTFTTDVIVGFPGETELDFEETVDAMRQVKFAKVHMFPYSDRPRTRSALMPNKVPSVVMRERKQTFMRIAEEIAFELRKAYVGREMSVLIESRKPDKEGMVTGYTENFLPVKLPGLGLKSNQIVKAHLLANAPAGLEGEVIA